jgi:hypothetical protein
VGHAIILIHQEDTQLLRPLLLLQPLEARVQPLLHLEDLDIMKIQIKDMAQLFHKKEHRMLPVAQDTIHQEEILIVCQNLTTGPLGLITLIMAHQTITALGVIIL